MLRLRFDGGDAKVSLRKGLNTVVIRVAKRGCHTDFRDGMGTAMRIVVEKVEAHVSAGEPPPQLMPKL